MNRGPRNIIMIPFNLCVWILQLLGRCFKLSYKQISVIVNLYLQGGILLLSGMMPFVLSIWSTIKSVNIWNAMLLLVCAAYLSIYIVGFVCMLKHYHQPMDYAFDKCATDLQILSKKTQISYYAVNLIIFILWWISLVCINFYIAYSISQLCL